MNDVTTPKEAQQIYRQRNKDKIAYVKEQIETAIENDFDGKKVTVHFYPDESDLSISRDLISKVCKEYEQAGWNFSIEINEEKYTKKTNRYIIQLSIKDEDTEDYPFSF